MEISIIVPMHNEEEGIPYFFERIGKVIKDIDCEIVCVNDGSKDSTLAKLKEYRENDERIKIIDLSRNFGKEAALTAGLDFSSGDGVIPIDADLQDPPEIIPDLIAKWKEGYKVVLATRRSRKTDTWLKRKTAGIFYKIINKMSSVFIPPNTGDFRLMDRQVVEAVGMCQERTRFMKGIFAWVGFKTATVYFDREERAAGNTSWNYWSLWKFALDGIFAFSTLPLKIWTYIGSFISLFAFLYAGFLTIRVFLVGTSVPGYTSIMVVMLFLGGIQLISLGIMGEYLARIYREAKKRPIYLVNEIIGVNEK